MAGSMVYRLRVADPGAAHMVRFRAALARAESISDNRGYNANAGFHGAPGWWCWHHQRSRQTPVQARLFLPWHRAYLWQLEQTLQELAQDPTVSLPWWDWTLDAGIPAAYAAPLLDGADNPLFKTHASVPSANPPIDADTTRDPGGNPQAVLPTADGIDGLVAPPPDGVADFESFSDFLENFHDDVHGWVGGDMGDITTAAFDPIFFAHHCMIDRVWAVWQVSNGNGTVPDALLDLPLQPFGKTFRDVLSVQALGYEYAATATEIPLGGQGGGNG